MGIKNWIPLSNSISNPISGKIVCLSFQNLKVGLAVRSPITVYILLEVAIT